MTADPLAPHQPALPPEDQAPASSAWALHPEIAQRLAAHVVAGPDAERVTVFTPLWASPIGEVPRSTVEDVERAFARARRAQRDWRNRSPRDRAKVLLKLHDAVLARQEEGLDIVQLETGKSRLHAFDEVADVALNARWVARQGPRILADTRNAGLMPVLTQAREVHHPKGVVGMISPWNYPLVLTISDAIPALMAGNAVVLKPDSQTPFTALWCTDLLEEAGLPSGLFQVVYGTGPVIGTAIIERADYICFTGSTATGKLVAQQAAARLVGVSLELGGKNPVYVAKDANLDRAAEAVVRDCFSNSGHACVSMERLIVHDAIADEFLERFVERVGALTLGADLDYAAEVGSIASQQQFEVLQQHVDDAVSKGATVLTGGRARPDVGPLFYEPTVLDNVPETAVCYAEETFGPLVSVYRVRSDAEGIKLANNTQYGLNASVWAKDGTRGARIARHIKAGTVTVNEAYSVGWASIGTPMGGRKQSGIGRRHGVQGLLRFTDTQSVVTQRVGLGVLYDRGGEFYSRFFTSLLRLTRTTRYPWP
jgi:succinate-semialdehyde dehydrogenase / glutarate-semialdehyde dehydrogenase